MAAIDPHDGDIVAGLAAIVVIAGVIPSIVAFARNHRHRWAILAVNLLGGWTVLGWVIAAVWSSTADVEPSKPVPDPVKGQNAA